MRGIAVLLAALWCMPALAAERSGGERLVYKIDSIIATVSHQQILIEVRGAVPSGGWKGAKLRLVHSPADPHVVVVDFLATPPAGTRRVIQGLLPVSAKTVAPWRRGVVSVRAVSSANEMTTQILK